MDEKKKRVSPQFDIDMELKRENWALIPILAPKYKIDESLDEIFEGRNYIKDY